MLTGDGGMAQPSRQGGSVRPIRVLHVADTESGAHWMFEILRKLQERGYEVGAVISGESGDLAPKLNRAGIPYSVQDMRITSPLDLVSLSRKVLRLAKLMRALRPDIVHYHLFRSVVLGRAAAWIAGVPCRFSMITGPFYLEAPAPREIDLRTLWMDTAVIASCERTRELYRRFGVKKRIELVYYGADPAHFDPSQADAQKLRRELGIAAHNPLVGMVAHFYPPLPAGPWSPSHLQGRGVKGHETFIHAARLILADKPNAKFVLVGAGWGDRGQAYEKGLREEVKAKRLDHAVLFTGVRRDIPDVLAGLDVAVQCSRSENLGGTIESLLMGRPTVATAVGGMVDTIRHNETGVLVPPDDPEALAQAIVGLLDDPEKARQLGRRGREWALERFTLAKTVDDLDRLYQQALKRAPLCTTGSRRDRYAWHRCIGRFCVLVVREAGPIVSFLARLARAQFRTWISKALCALGRCLALDAKRAMDIVIAVLLLLFFAPLMILSALLILVSMGRPVLYRQTRTGLNGCPFVLYKFRTMIEAGDGPGERLPDESRVTPVGRVLRRSSLDELPELFNVLKGNMSLVGPRPLLPEYLPLYTPHQARRHDVKPGITGWALVHGRNALTWEEKFELDVWYVEHRTLALDIKILLWTLWKVLKGEGISHPGHATMPEFRGDNR